MKNVVFSHRAEKPIQIKRKIALYVKISSYQENNHESACTSQWVFYTVSFLCNSG